MRRRTIALLLALTGAFAWPAHAAPAAAQRIDPTIGRRLHATHPPDPLGGVQVGGEPVLVVLAPDPTTGGTSSLDTVAALPGVQLVRAHGRYALVRVDGLGLGSLVASRAVERALSARTPSSRPPLDRSAERLHLEAARGYASTALAGRDRFTGEGITIADVDTALDVFHPAFFRGDGGWVSWIDVDGDGAFETGVDAIDLDGDGLVGEGEVGTVLQASPLSLSTGRAVSSQRGGAFDPAIDWVFLDQNGDGVRNVGSDAGATDATPAFGEPIFTPDDLDRDGVLEINERFVRLGTSKVREALVDLIGPSSPQRHEYVRGTDLSTYQRDYTNGIYGYADTLHGTGVAGILVGDLPLLGRRFVGIAPDAELISSFYWGESQVDPVLWALERNPDVVLHEYVVWAGVVLDGGDALGALIDDTTTTDSVAHVCPAGNIGGARKHASFAAVSGTPVEMPLSVPDGTSYWQVSVYAPSGTIGAMLLREADGTEHVFVDGRNGSLADLSGRAYAEVLTSTHGFDTWTFTVASASGNPVTSGDFTVVVTTNTDETLHTLLNDSTSGFALGVAFPAELATDASTIAWPATSDACTAVGATPSHTADEGSWARDGGDEAFGEVRAYSGRGPRIDGEQFVHVLAPDNPWAALGAGAVYPTYPDFLTAPEGSFQVFGGTSGAGPHVAGLASLLVEQGVTGADVRARLIASAVDDGLGGVLPNGDYGYGRIDALRALASAAGSDVIDDGGERPTVTLAASAAQVPVGTAITLTVTASDPDGTDVEATWDDGYDGTWDAEYAAVSGSATRSWTPTGSGYQFAKVRVRDAHGLLAEASVRVLVGDAPAPDAGVPDGGMSGGGGGESGGCGCAAVGGATSGNAWAWSGFGTLALLVASRRRRASR